MSSTSKMDVSTVFEMFEEISKKLDRPATHTVEPVQIDLTAIDTLTERLWNVIEEVKKPSKVKHQHTIEIASNWFFLSWVALVIIILGLFWTLANQRQTIGQYMETDLKYRYIKMQGQTNEEALYRLERQFRYSDSIKIIRKQVGKYEELVKEQAERMERTKRAMNEYEIIQKKVKILKRR